jgi:hypothetical protein
MAAFGIFMAASCGAFASQSGRPPQVYGMPPQNLVAAKRLIEEGSPSVKPAYAKLMEKANYALLAKPRSVMDKTLVAASGDKHDFFSFGPYWWPDPTKPNGLPYTKRDGYLNPESKNGTDSNAFVATCNNIEALALAYYFTGQRPYAVKAVELVRVWFLNADTAMNPSANYGQAIPGGPDGRFEGIIELRHLTRVADSLALIENTVPASDPDQVAFRQWLARYLDWLMNNKLSAEETSKTNNHVSWRSVQIVHFLIILDREDDAHAFLKEEMPRLLATQVGTKGNQDHELARTNSLGYSLFNLEALYRLAVLGDALGVDCWKFGGQKGALVEALDYLAPYADPAVPWPKDEVRPAERSRLLPLIIQAHARKGSTEHLHLLQRFLGEGADLWRLQWSSIGIETSSTGSIR